jgi:hypothetical protein
LADSVLPVLPVFPVVSPTKDSGLLICRLGQSIVFSRLCLRIDAQLREQIGDIDAERLQLLQESEDDRWCGRGEAIDPARAVAISLLDHHHLVDIAEG